MAKPANKLVQPYLLRNYDRNGHKTCPLYVYKKWNLTSFSLSLRSQASKRNG